MVINQETWPYLEAYQNAFHNNCFFQVTIPNNNVSSAYCTFVTETLLHLGKPLVQPTARVLSNILLRPSTANTNIRGDNGPPCLRRLLQAISFPDIPFSRICNLVNASHRSTQLNHRWSKAMCLNTSLRHFQSSISYAFWKSNFNINPFCPCNCV